MHRSSETILWIACLYVLSLLLLRQLLLLYAAELAFLVQFTLFMLENINVSAKYIYSIRLISIELYFFGLRICL